MAKEEEEFDNDDYEEIDEDEAPKKKHKIIREIEKEAKEIKKPEARFQVYHYPERAGILDTETKETIGEDVYSILCAILNKVSRIEESVG